MSGAQEEWLGMLALINSLRSFLSHTFIAPVDSMRPAWWRWSSVNWLWTMILNLLSRMLHDGLLGAQPRFPRRGRWLFLHRGHAIWKPKWPIEATPILTGVKGSLDSPLGSQGGLMFDNGHLVHFRGFISRNCFIFFNATCVPTECRSYGVTCVYTGMWIYYMSLSFNLSGTYKHCWK